jgi:hypothetical protein
MRTIKKLRPRTSVALTVLIVGGGLLFGPQAASAQTCIQDVWKAHGNNQNLQCTANDVTLSTATNINISIGGECVIENGVRVCRCDAGGTVTFTADFQMDLTADTRYDVGFYIATDGDPNHDGAITGQCSATASLTSNTTRPGNFINLDTDQPGDVCGDITGPFNTAHNPLFVTAQITTQCPLTPGQKLTLPFATTWRQPGSNEVCDGTGNGTTTNDVFPGSPSKCNKGTLTLDIIARPPAITVVKTALTEFVLETGGSASYSVTVTNLNPVIPVTLTSLTDVPYGDITHVQGAVTATTCVPDTPPNSDPATCEVGGTIAPLATCSCTFTATVPPGDVPGSFRDEVRADAVDAFGQTTFDTDDAEVPYRDVSVPPSLTKTATSAQCVIDVTYDVVVTNGNALETLTLNTLTDDVYGSITTAHAVNTSCAGSAIPGVCEQVVSTTCGQAPPNGPGALPFLIAPAGNYACRFVGRINNCNTSLTDTVTGGTVDEDGVVFTPSDFATVIVMVSRP